ncbi:MAG TPA: rhodanese-like domain-containing protein [Thermoanaerobaculia bacterium]|nr:rhodanese-like domain-containing protein [Thermoanaerobaculia bacterium]
MPTRYTEDGAAPIVQFDPQLEVSPFAVFRRLREGRPPLLVDVRPAPGALSLAGSLAAPDAGWSPPADEDVVLFDEDGTLACEAARRLQAAGHPRVRALFGGLSLWEFALDPEVVGAETYLRRRS